MINEKVTVIIPTLCSIKREFELLRAIASIKCQIDIVVDIFVVVNGNFFDKELLNNIKNIYGVKVVLLDAAGISKARHFGRRHVVTPYFMFLDDDDELLPNAIRELLNTYNSSEIDTGVVIADAYNDYRERNYGFSPSPECIEVDPLNALMHKNWLLIQSALFKTDRVPEKIFDIKTDSNECTMIAFNLALENIKIRINEKSLAIIHDRADSESKSEHFITKESSVIMWMLTKDVPAGVRVKLQYKLASAFHNNSVYYLKKNKFINSLSEHFKSLLVPGGVRYALYGRHILSGLIKYLR